jgi:hypothetical protein
MITYSKTTQGALRLSTLVNGYLVTHQFFGYSKKEATKEFKQILKIKEKKD